MGAEWSNQAVTPDDRRVQDALDLIDCMNEQQIVAVLQHIPGMQARTFKARLRLTYHAPIQRRERKARQRKVRRMLNGVKDIIG